MLKDDIEGIFNNLVCKIVEVDSGKNNLRTIRMFDKRLLQELMKRRDKT